MAIRYFNLSIRNLAWRLRKFDEILGEFLVQEIKNHSEEIVSLVTQKQLYEKGINGKNIEIMSYRPYKPSTIKYKSKKGQPTNRVTLKDTGKWYSSLSVEFDVDGFFITSLTDNVKSGFLRKKYGDEILRLTNEDLNIVIRQYIRPALEEKLKAYLQSDEGL